jgi:hypothetical protein
LQNNSHQLQISNYANMEHKNYQEVEKWGGFTGDQSKIVSSIIKSLGRSVTEQAGLSTVLQTCTWEVLRTNFSQDAIYLHWGFSWFASFPLGKCWATTNPFPFIIFLSSYHSMLHSLWYWKFRKKEDTVSFIELCSVLLIETNLISRTISASYSI